MKIIERNSMINMFLLGLSIYLGVTVSLWFLLLWPAALFINDIFQYAFGWSIFETSVQVVRAYQFYNVFFQAQSGKGIDLGFNLYNGKLSKSPNQAQNDKWDLMFQQLQLSPGDSLLDIGCGYGDWLNYAKSKGVRVMGINITYEQVAFCRSEYGLDVICTDWKKIPQDPELQKQLYGQFDAVTFMDTIEHYVPSRDRNNPQVQSEIYSSMFRMANHLASLFLAYIKKSSRLRLSNKPSIAIFSINVFLAVIR